MIICSIQIWFKLSSAFSVIDLLQDELTKEEDRVGDVVYLCLAGLKQVRYPVFLAGERKLLRLKSDWRSFNPCRDHSNWIALLLDMQANSSGVELLRIISKFRKSKKMSLYLDYASVAVVAP